MRLEVGSIAIRDVELGARTELRDHTLVIDPDDIRQVVLEDPHFADVEVHLARPGESVRIIHVLDVIEPRWKVSGPGGVFPGFVAPPTAVGEGRTHRLAGVAVVEVGQPVPGEGTHFRQRLIDMAGPGAEYSPFGQTLNVVLHFKPNLDFFSAGTAAKQDFHGGTPASSEYNRAMLQTAMKVAARLGRTSQNVQPDEVETFELSPCDPSLLKVVCIYHQRDPSFLYGVPVELPMGTVFHPNEVFDGALAEFRAGLFVAPTYWEQNNEVLLELCRRHGKELCFLGCILFGAVTPSHAEKERVASAAAKLARLMGAQAAVLLGTSQTNYAIDLMWALQKCEQAGIKTTMIYYDRGNGPDDPGFMFSVPEADAIVCAGSHELAVTLPAMQKVIGGDHLIDPDMDARGEITVPLRYVHSAVGVQGYHRLTTRFE